MVVIGIDQGPRECSSPLPHIMTYALTIWGDVKQARLLSAMEVAF